MRLRPARPRPDVMDATWRRLIWKAAQALPKFRNRLAGRLFVHVLRLVEDLFLCLRVHERSFDAGTSPKEFRIAFQPFSSVAADRAGASETDPPPAPQARAARFFCRNFCQSC